MKSQLIILFTLFSISLNTLAFDRNHAQFYLDTYGRANSENPLISRVHKIFEKVSSVADKRRRSLPRLIIVKGFNSTDNLPLALPDGHIVLSEQNLEIIYNKVSLEHGDTRLAFILGHELAHLAKDEFWHRAHLMGSQSAISDELEADSRGFIYAAMAGYPVDKLLADGEHNFFVYWQGKQNLHAISKTHPSAENRAKILQKHLQALLSNLPYFEFGVRLSHFNRCDDAVYFFEEFLSHFPAREVYNNLGFCKLQQARKLLLDKESYWLPFVLDVATQIEDFSYTPKGEKNKLATEFLKKAQQYLQLAVEMDASYVPARINLAITALYLGNIYQARMIIEEALQLAPNDLEVKSLRAVILYEEGVQSPYVDMWIPAIEILEDLSKQANPPYSVLFNMAVLLEQRGRTGAIEIWQGLAKNSAYLPIAIRQIVCKKTSCPPLQAIKAKNNWQLPSLKIGVKIRRDKPTRKILRRWKKLERRLPEIRETIYQEPNGTASVLALKGWLEMLVLKNTNGMKIKELGNYCGQKLRKRRVMNGTILSCKNWAALVIDDKVAEIWLVK